MDYDLYDMYAINLFPVSSLYSVVAKLQGLVPTYHLYCKMLLAGGNTLE